MGIPLSGHNAVHLPVISTLKVARKKKEAFLEPRLQFADYVQMYYLLTGPGRSCVVSGFVSWM